MRSHKTIPGSVRTALAVAVEQQRRASSAACTATAGRPSATANVPAQRSCDSGRARERCGCGDSRCADTALTALPSARSRALPGCLATLVTQRRSRHLKQRAGPPRRETTLRAIRNLTPTGRHAHQFFAATSFMTSISRSRSATSFFSRAFSASSCFRRLMSFAQATEPLAPCMPSIEIVGVRRSADRPANDSGAQLRMNPSRRR